MLFIERIKREAPLTRGAFLCILFEQMNKFQILMLVFISLGEFYTQGAGATAVARERVILEATAEAVSRGVIPGTPVRLARRRCPGLEVRDFRAEDYAERYEQAWSVCAEFTPQVETVDLHEGFLDITQDMKRFGGTDKLVKELGLELAKRARVKLKWGGGADKWMAWLARQHGQFVAPVMETLVLSKLPVESMALPERATERLHHFDIHTVAQVMSLPAGFLEAHLGFEREFVLSKMTRHKESVRVNFPAPSVSITEEIADSDEQRVERAVMQAARSLTERLCEAKLWTTLLRVRFASKTRAEARDVKLQASELTATRLERMLFEQLPGNLRAALRRIEIEAHGLLPMVAPQSTLWGERVRGDADQALERVQVRLAARFGSTTLLNGTEAFERQQPRFAQLVYQTRGISLP